MKIVVEQSELKNQALLLESYQEPFPPYVACRKCENKKAILYMIVNDEAGEIIKERPADAKVWPHDASSVVVYFCCSCGSMRARWNQG